MCGSIAKNDALAKARGEPTHGFHNIQPNYSNPEIIAAVADQKAGRSTNFHNTGAPNIWQQYADSNQSSKEDAPPPVLRDNISNGASDLKISKRRDRAEKRKVASGRSVSKVKTFKGK